MQNSKKSEMTFYLYNNLSKIFVKLRDGSVCGRVSGDLIFPDDPSISREHCRFTIEGSEIYIHDYGTTNKTFVNSVPILPNRKRRIRINDVIEFGSHRFTLTTQSKFGPGTSLASSVNQKEAKYRAIKKDDGSLTAFVTGLISKNTAVTVNRLNYQRLKLKKRLRPHKKNAPVAAILLVAFFVLGAFLFPNTTPKVEECTNANSKSKICAGQLKKSSRHPATLLLKK